MKAWKPIVTAEGEFRLQRQSITPAKTETRQQLNSTASEGFSELQSGPLVNTGPHHSGLEHRYARRPDLKRPHLKSRSRSVASRIMPGVAGQPGCQFPLWLDSPFYTQESNDFTCMTGAEFDAVRAEAADLFQRKARSE